MQASLEQSVNTRASAVSLGKNHGYRFDGDTAILSAELSIDGAASFTKSGWALQLWACDAPYQGGALHGIKVAEAALELAQAEGKAARLEAEASARLPPAQRAYAMVLVLASGKAGTYDQVHDFSNYPLRQNFSGPHLEGLVGYRFQDEAVVLQAERVFNPRSVENLSGTLALELWALRNPYQGGAIEAVDGVLLAQASLERLAGQQASEGVERSVPLAQPGAGIWHLSVMLREWTAAFGYVTRDFCNFVEPYQRSELPRSESVAEQPVAKATFVSASTAVPESVQEQPVAKPSLVGMPVVVESVREPVVPASPLVNAPPARAKSVREGSGVKRTSESAAPTASAKPPVRAAAVLESRANEPAAGERTRVSIQHASVDDLASVPGLNKKLAAAIIKARPYASLDELERVRGIGDKMVRKLRDYLTV